MPSRTIMAWNIQNYGTTKHNAYGAEMVAFISEVMNQHQADLLAICEIRNAAAATIGADLVNELDNSPMGGDWVYEDSPQYGAPRWEQYLFVWDRNRITNNSFTGSFPRPTVPVTYYGFPTLTKHRPPYCGDFNFGAKRVLITMYHAPNPSQLYPKIRDACNNIADLAVLAQHDGSIIMGDFNVPYDEDVTTANTNGRYAYNYLAGAGRGYTELLINQDTSLISYGNAAIVTTVAGGFSQPYDKFFIRNANNGVTSGGTTVETILGGGSGGGIYQASMQAIQNANNVAWVLVGGNYSMPQAFRLYRGWVSDHVPIVMTVNY